MKLLLRILLASATLVLFISGVLGLISLPEQLRVWTDWIRDIEVRFELIAASLLLAAFVLTWVPRETVRGWLGLPDRSRDELEAELAIKEAECARLIEENEALDLQLHPPDERRLEEARRLLRAARDDVIKMVESVPGTNVVIMSHLEDVARLAQALLLGKYQAHFNEVVTRQDRRDMYLKSRGARCAGIAESLGEVTEFLEIAPAGQALEELVRRQDEVDGVAYLNPGWRPIEGRGWRDYG